MKILSLHCDYIKFKALKKAIKNPEELSDKEKVEKEVKETLGIFVAVEKTDELNKKEVIQFLFDNILDLKEKTGAEKIVLYPYAHLSSKLSNPDFALEVLKETEKKLKDKKMFVYRAPFGYYKSLELKCKGHPLAELSREISFEKQKKIEEEYDPKKLLNQISRAKLDTSKLKENDHRILGQKLDLFSFQDVAPGMVFWHSKGLIIYNELINFWRDEHRKAGYEEVSTPQILDKKLWQISGHWEKYKENIFLTNYEDRDFAVKPMNCPGGILIFKTSPKSYKSLPLKVAELGIVHRIELSGVLGGLFRAIKFTQDDAHIYCTKEQVEEELKKIVNLAHLFYNKFNLEIDHIELSTRPEKKIGDEKMWDLAEKTLEKVLKTLKISYSINKGDGAFYGPKIDFHVKDSLERTWQCATVQLDFSMPERFELEYTDRDNKKKRPIMIHRTIYGSLERFLGILLEHTKANLPLWLSPIQVRVLSFTDRNIDSAKKIVETLRSEGVRIDDDFESTTISEKVRNAEMQKIPYVVVIGDKEEENNTIALRKRGEKVKYNIKLNDFIALLTEEIKQRI